jgi:hypothetical protein
VRVPVSDEQYSAMEEYVGRVRGLVISLMDILSPDERAEINELIDHGEPVEGLRSLAWIVVEERKRLPATSYRTLLELMGDWFEPEDLPPNLAEFVVPES